MTWVSKAMILSQRPENYYFDDLYHLDLWLGSLVFPPETEQVERLVDNPNVEVGEEPETTEEVTTEITTEAAPQEKPQRPVKKPDDNWYDKPYLIQSAIRYA